MKTLKEFEKLNGLYCRELKAKRYYKKLGSAYLKEFEQHKQKAKELKFKIKEVLIK